MTEVHYLEAARLFQEAGTPVPAGGGLAMTELHYLEAARLFKEAATLVPAGHEGERLNYLNAEANALYRQGDEFGDNAAALSAIERYRHLGELRPQSGF